MYVQREREIERGRETRQRDRETERDGETETERNRDKDVLTGRTNNCGKRRFCGGFLEYYPKLGCVKERPVIHMRLGLSHYKRERL